MFRNFFTIIFICFLSFSLFAEGNLASQPTKLELEIRGDLSMNTKSFSMSALINKCLNYIFYSFDVQGIDETN